MLDMPNDALETLDEASLGLCREGGLKTPAVPMAPLLGNNSLDAAPAT
jgi:hypothetical protein